MAEIIQATRNSRETHIISEGPPGLVLGYLEDLCSVDIVVNSAPVHMKLNDCGSVSQAILSRAGPAIQDECDVKYPNGIQLGQVAITSGARLPYSVVFHCTVQPMTADNCYTEMTKLIKNCLREADGRDIVKNNGEEIKAQTIAFPLLGTGGKGLNPDICRVFYRTMLSFLLGPTESLTNSYIIVTPKDQQLIDVIKLMKPLSEMKQSTYEFCYPKIWQETQDTLNVIELKEGNKEYELIVDNFMISPPSNSKILSIYRIENKGLYKRLLEKKCENKLFKKTYERQLWLHANDNNDAQEIYTNGLNANFMKVSRNGNGYYFCESSSLADDMRTQRNMPLQMFYCTVLVGKKLDIGRKDCNKNNIPKGSFCTVDMQPPTLYTIFDENHFYPNYLINYETN